MEPEDEESMAEVKKEFDAVANFLEQEVHGFKMPEKKFVNLYAAVYNAATRPKVTQVHDHYKVQGLLYQACQNILISYAVRFSPDISAPGEELYREVCFRWPRYKLMLRWIQKTFAYLSRYYIVHCNVPALEDVGYRIFYERIFGDISQKLAVTILQFLNRERQGDHIESNDIALGTELFVKMNTVKQTLYQERLASPVVEMTAEYYRREAALWLATDSTTTYLEKAEMCLSAEQRRCNKYFLRTTEQEIVRQVERELLAVHQEQLLTKENSGFVALLRDLRTVHLHRMYTLFERLPNGLDPMGRLLKEQCLFEAQEIAKRYGGEADANFQGYVTDFIALHEKYNRLLSEQLGSNPVFQKALKDAFETGLNQGLAVGDGSPGALRIHAAELLSNYCDAILRGAEKLTDTELEQRFDGFVGLFAHVTEKDMFQAHARRHLCRRLLTGTSNEEMEKTLIAKLKAKCGNTFTSHFEGMINDRNVSLEQQSAFGQFLTTACQGPPPYEFSALILTSGFWPKQPADELILPPEAKALYEMFQTFYHQKTSHRVLTWTNSNATATVLGRYQTTIREFQVTGFQACVLLKYNARDTYTASELAKELKLDWDELKRILPSFTRLKILSRTSDATVLRETDVFTYNPEFTCPHRKMKIPLTQPKIVAQQSAQVRTLVEEDRKPAIDACLVRIMKHRKQLDHTSLLTECIQQLSGKFQPDPKLIKLRIEDLINREFLERIPDKVPSSYRYLA